MLTEGLGSDSSPEIERDAPSTGGLKFRALLVRLNGGSHGGASCPIRSTRNLKTGLIRFGMLEAFPAGPIIDLLADFRHQYPTIEVKLEEGTSEENTSRVRRGLLEVASAQMV